MIQNVVGLFTNPDRAWRTIKSGDAIFGPIHVVHILVLAAIPAVSAYIGTTQVGWTIGSLEPVRLTQASALQMTVLTWLAMLAGVAVMGAFIHWMSRTYDSSPSLSECVIFAAYTATPLFLAGLIALYPNLWLAMLVGTSAICYTAYLLYQGIPIFMNIPSEEGFLFSSSILAVGLVVLVGMMATAVIFWGLGIGPIYLR